MIACWIASRDSPVSWSRPLGPGSAAGAGSCGGWQWAPCPPSCRHSALRKSALRIAGRSLALADRSRPAGHHYLAISTTWAA